MFTEDFRTKPSKKKNLEYIKDENECDCNTKTEANFKTITLEISFFYEEFVPKGITKAEGFIDSGHFLDQGNFLHLSIIK